MRPHIICHMISTIDGKIDSAAFRALTGAGVYETTGARLEGDAWICGRVTMQPFAEEEPFVSATNIAAGPQPVHIARRSASHAVVVDTVGTLQWADGDIDGDHLVCIVSERVPEDYLRMLREHGVSYIVAGESSVDLGQAVESLGRDFGIRRLLLEGGGHINGAFLRANLIDELSLLVVPGIDGRRGIVTLFDGLDPGSDAAVPLKLISVERRDDDILWLRYAVARS